MLLKIRATENYQVIETEVEVKKISEAAKILKELRNAILVATNDVEAKKKPTVDEKIAQEKQKTAPIAYISQNQKQYLIRLGMREEDIKDFTREEASQMISNLTSR